MKILIPVDGSECSKATLEWAAATLSQSGSQYYILCVVPKGAPELMTFEYQVEDALKYINEAEAFLKGKGCTVAKAEYIEGDPVDSICQYAEDMNVDQVLMGSHGRTGLAKMLLGSISTGVMERCKKQVFILKNLVKQPAKA